MGVGKHARPGANVSRSNVSRLLGTSVVSALPSTSRKMGV